MLASRLALEPALLSEPILGWRVWALEGSIRGDRVRLRPIAKRGKPWRPREPAIARCTTKPGHRLVPSPNCRCGLHATHEPDLLRQARDPAVLGSVAMWGRVIEHERGYRAQLAYPQRLRLACPLCLWWWGPSAPSPCEVVIRHRGGRMVPLCAPHLELSERYGYPARRRLDAVAVEGTLLSTYAVDLLRTA